MEQRQKGSVFKRMSLGKKLLLAFLAVGVIPFAVISIVSLFKSSKALSEQSFNQLSMVRQIKKNQLERFFSERQGDLGVLLDTAGAQTYAAKEKLAAIQQLKKNQIEDYFAAMQSQLKVLAGEPYVLRTLQEFNASFEMSGDQVLTPTYLRLAEEYDPYFKAIMEEYGWYDIFLIHTDGDIVYTVARESDLGMIIPESELKDSGLGDAFARVLTSAPGEIITADFEPYAPSNGDQAAFMALKLLDGEGRPAGVLAFQVPIDKTNQIVQQRDGMGTTGETYLVGRYEGRTAFRSTMTTMGDGKYVVGYEISTPYIEEALKGNSNIEIYTDSSGFLNIVAFNPLRINGFNWVCVTKMHLEEAVAIRLPGEQDDFFT